MYKYLIRCILIFFAILVMRSPFGILINPLVLINITFNSHLAPDVETPILAKWQRNHAWFHPLKIGVSELFGNGARYES